MAPVYFGGAALLVVSGTAKLRRPGPPARALGALHLPAGPAAARILGSGEIAVGALAIVRPGLAGGSALAATYGVFAGFLFLLARRDDPTATCGCLGERDAPPSLLHVALDLIAAATGVAVALSPLPPPSSFVTALPLGGVTFVAGTALVAYLAYLAVVFVPTLFWSYRGRA